MGFEYNELYEKYKVLKQENRRLKDEIILLRRALTKEKMETYNFAGSTIIRKNDMGQGSNIITMNSTNEEKIQQIFNIYGDANCLERDYCTICRKAS